MLHRLILLCLCLVLCLMPSAHAAERIPSASAFDQPVDLPFLLSLCDTYNVAALVDDDPTTFWARIANKDDADAVAAQAELMLYPAGATVGAIWLRSGNYASASHYAAYARPLLIHVRLYTDPTCSAPAAEYDYLLDDLYQPSGQHSGWSDGYQQLSLPHPLAGVTRIDLYTVNYAAGSRYTDTICLSDIRLTANSSSSVPKATATPAPQRPAQGPVEAQLLMRMATRSGPSTDYSELGSYFKAGYDVRVLSVCYDENNVPWVQVEFTYQSSLRRAYTGLKRVDVDPSCLPEEQEGVTVRTIRKADARFGPGKAYASHKLTIPSGVYGLVFAHENGYVQFEYYDEDDEILRRVWIPENCIQ